MNEAFLKMLTALRHVLTWALTDDVPFDVFVEEIVPEVEDAILLAELFIDDPQFDMVKLNM